MGVWRLTVNKAGTFQEPSGVEWSNVYTLKTPFGEELNAANAIDSIVALERIVHSSDVRFTRATVYLKSLSGASYQPFYGKDLTGVGAVTNASDTIDIYRECALLFQFELPRSGGLIGIGRSRRLSKWLHVYRLRSSSTPTAVGAAPLTGSAIAFYKEQYATPLRNNLHGGGKLTNEDGDEPTASDVQAHLNHHQYHRGT